jgi:glycosyltransferase involved in cell wall biosynthesis
MIELNANQPRPPISVVVCTRDRPESLARCLVALGQLDYPDYEVVVVDNASRSAATAQLVATTPFRYVREDRVGLNWARNLGWASARHAIVAYTDDDTEPDPGWLRGIAAALAEPRVAAMTGLVLPAALETEAERLFERYGGMGKGCAQRLFVPAAMTARQLIAVQHCGVGANMAFRRSALVALGGFDTALDVGTPAGGAGDLDLFHRLIAAGFLLCYQPEAIARHHHRRDRNALQRQLAANGRSFGVYLLKIWCRRSVPRRSLVRFAAGWMGGWLLARLAASLVGRLDFPASLVWAELYGALSAPATYRATYRRDRALRHETRG